MIQELEDRKLLDLYNSGEKLLVFNELVRRYQKRIYYVARRMVKRHEDADDIAQEVVKAYTALDNFRGDSNIYTWLYRIAINLSINHLRKQKVRKFFDIDEYADILGKDADQDKKLIKEENVSLIEKAILTLPDKQKSVFIMRYYDELPYEEISNILGTSVGGLKANFHHAVSKVSEYVNKAHAERKLTVEKNTISNMNNLNSKLNEDETIDFEVKKLKNLLHEIGEDVKGYKDEPDETYFQNFLFNVHSKISTPKKLSFFDRFWKPSTMLILPSFIIISLFLFKNNNVNYNIKLGNVITKVENYIYPFENLYTQRNSSEIAETEGNISGFNNSTSLVLNRRQLKLLKAISLEDENGIISSLEIKD